MKSVIVHIHDDSALAGRLAVALDLCRAHDAHLTCLMAAPYAAYGGLDPAAGMMVSAAVINDLQAAQDRLRHDIENRLVDGDVRWDWQAVNGDVAQVLVAATALADLLVVSQSARTSAGPRPLPIVSEVAIHAACPVLMVPDGMDRIDPQAPIVIGWNGSDQAASALRQTIALMARARAVHLVSIGTMSHEISQMEAGAYLSRHGVMAELHIIDPGVRDPEDVLAHFARDHGAGAIVMGAYGRSRLRETLLGGVTRNLIAESDIPLLLAR